MRFLVVMNRNHAATVDMFYQLSAYFSSQGFDCDALDVSDLPSASFVFEAPPEEVNAAYGSDYDFIITLGGDGTIIHTARLAYVMHTPILGLNMGHLGFLANDIEDGAIPLIAEALADELVREQRMSLRIEVYCVGDHVEEGESNEPLTFFAINEIAMARGAQGHMVDYSFSISGDKIASMRGDGLVVATATGSTAYALSAGGPLVGCNLRGMIIVPLAPHTLNSRAIVTEYQDVVEVNFDEESNTPHEVSLFVDGDALTFERPISSVVVSVNSEPVTLLNRHRESFYKQIARTFFNQQ